MNFKFPFCSFVKVVLAPSNLYSDFNFFIEMIDSLKDQYAEPIKMAKEEKITKVEIKKKYEVQQKPPQTAIKSTTTQSQTSKRKYGTKKKSKILFKSK